jgi:hypothetical protein
MMAKYSDMDPKPNVKKNIFGKPKTTYSYKMDEGGTNIVRMKTKAVKKIGGGKWAYETTTAPKQKPGKTRYANPQRGVKIGGLKSLFGGGKSSSASSAKPNKNWSSNPARAARQKERAKGREKVCGPNGCTTRKRMERLRDR